MGKKSKEDFVPTINSVQNRDIIQRLNFMYQAGTYLQSLGAPSSSKSTLDPVSMSCEETSDYTSSRRKRTNKKGGRGPAHTPKRAKRDPAVLKAELNTLGDLGRSYVRSMKVVGQKTTVKMDPSIKRAICQGCDVPFIPGSTVATRVEKLSSHRHAILYKCLLCNTKRRIPAPPTMPLSAPASFTAADGITTKEPNGQVPTGQHRDLDTGLVVQLQNSLAGQDEHADASNESSRTRRPTRIHKTRRPTVSPRLPILSERLDAGHVLFVGSQKLPGNHGPSTQ